MDDLTFLESCGTPNDGNAVLKVVLPDGQVCHISDRISPYQFLERCPLLYHAFEFGYMNRLQASIEACSLTAAIALLRYCYTGNYLPPCMDETAGLLLIHAQTYKLAEDFDVPELQLLAHGNFSCQIDFACCQPTPPRDLLETIRFVYDYFANGHSRLQNGLVSTLCNYCISIFLYHRLREQQEFMQLVSDIPEFGQDLCVTNMDRNFEDDCAFDIIRLSLDTTSQPIPQPTAQAPQAALQDTPLDLFIRDLEEPQPTNMINAIHTAIDQINHAENQAARETMPQLTPNVPSMITLVHRLRAPQDSTDVGLEFDSSSSDDDGFTLVHHPRPQAPPRTPDDIMSSPEIIPTPPVDVLALTGSEYPSDDEWSMV